MLATFAHWLTETDTTIPKDWQQALSGHELSNMANTVRTVLPYMTKGAGFLR